MAGFVAQGSTFSFTPAAGSSVVLAATRVAVEEPTAEYVNMTSALSTATAALNLVPTGDFLSLGAVSVDFICSPGRTTLKDIIGRSGTLSFTGSSFNFSTKAIAESGEITAGIGEVVSGRALFRITS